MSVPGIRQAVRTPDGGVWILKNGEIEYRNGSADVRTVIEVNRFGYGDASLMAVDGFDETAWIVTAQQALLHFGRTGELLAGWTLPGAAASIGIGLDQRVWIAGEREAWQFETSGTLAATYPFEGRWTQPVVSLSVDSLRSRVLLVGLTAIGAIAIDGADATIDVTDRGTIIRGSALDPKSGTLWLLTDEGLRAYDGVQPIEHALYASEAIGAGSDIAYDSASDRVVVLSPGALHAIDRSGNTMRSIALPEPEQGLRFAATAFRLLPRITLTRPPTNASTSIAMPQVILQAEALCNASACDVLPAYLATLELIASINGRVIDGLQFNAETGRAAFTPASPLGLGANTFSAVAIDRFGHGSNEIRTEWTLLAPVSPDTVQIAAANKPPTVSITAPTNNANFLPGSNVTLTATASDTDGTVTKVAFYRGGATLIGTALSGPPYSVVWSSVAAGTYALTAKATDNKNATATSAVVNITVAVPPNSPPAVSLTGPANGTVLDSPASVTIAASATDSDGTVSKIDFYDGTNLLGTVTGSGASLDATWPYNNIPAGTHTLKATATDNAGGVASATSTLIVNAAPLVVLTQPANCAVFTGPTSIFIAADALDTDGSVARVEFYQGTTLIATVTRAPYTYVWTNVAIGSYSLTAVATDNRGKTKISAPLTITVAPPNSPPTAVLTAPTEGQQFGSGSTVALTATASDADGTVAQVEFWVNGGRIAVDSQPPYATTWSGMPPGNYTLFARAVDNLGLVGDSATVHVTVSSNNPPSVTLTSPTIGASYRLPANVPLAVSASDSDGSVSKVEYYQGGTLIASSTQPPFSATWTNPPAGNYSITANATDNLNATGTSNAVTISVVANTPPTAVLTAPSSGASFFAPATMTLTATAQDADGTIDHVDFYSGSTPIGSSTGPSYSTIWSNVAAGTYTLTARAVDNDGAITTSAASLITVNAVGVALTSPANGASIGDDNVVVSGTVLAPANSGVFVNGAPATVSADGTFYLNNVPLLAGSNNITVSVTTLDNAVVSQTTTAMSTGSAPFSVAVDPQEGFVPFATDLTIVNRGNVAFQRIEVDITSDGTPDSTLASLPAEGPALRITYATPGTYTITITAFDASDVVIYSTQRKVRAIDPVDQVTLLTQIYTGMLERLRAGNIAGAVNVFSQTVQSRYQALFTQLGSDLSAVILQLGTPTSVTFGTDFGQLVLVRTEADGNHAYPVTFVRGADGLWRITGM